MSDEHSLRLTRSRTNICPSTTTTARTARHWCLCSSCQSVVDDMIMVAGNPLACEALGGRRATIGDLWRPIPKFEVDRFRNVEFTLVSRRLIYGHDHSFSCLVAANLHFATINRLGAACLIGRPAIRRLFATSGRRWLIRPRQTHSECELVNERNEISGRCHCGQVECQCGQDEW